MNIFSILTKKDISHNPKYPERLSIFEDRQWVIAELSDFAVLKGARIYRIGYSKSWRHQQVEQARKGAPKTNEVPCGIYWLQDSTKPYNEEQTYTKYDYWGDIEDEHTYFPYPSDNDVLTSDDKSTRPTNQDIGIRVTVPYSYIKDDCTRKEIDQLDGWLEVEYGEYPQSLAPIEIQEELEKQYQQGTLKTTDKQYLIDTLYKEYIHEGSKYIRVDAYNKTPYKKNGKEYKDRDIAWIKVEPITWWVDETKDIAITERNLIAGISFHNKKEYDGNFKDSKLRVYLNQFFAKDIKPSTVQRTIKVIPQLKEKVDKLQTHKKEIEKEFGKTFDKEIRKDKAKDKKEPVKVKAKVKK